MLRTAAPPIHSCSTILLLLAMSAGGMGGSRDKIQVPSAGAIAAVQVLGRRATMNQTGCRYHPDCAADEFCAAEFCEAADVKMPCARCRACAACVCDSQAVDNYCPAKCGERR
jgi:hypothetical protein